MCLPGPAGVYGLMRVCPESVWLEIEVNQPRFFSVLPWFCRVLRSLQVTRCSVLLSGSVILMLVLEGFGCFKLGASVCV